MKFHSTYEFMYNCNGFIAVNQTIKVIGCLLFHIVARYKSWLECFYASKHITTITHRQLCNTLSIRFLSFLNAFKQVLEASLRKMNQIYLIYLTLTARKKLITITVLSRCSKISRSHHRYKLYLFISIVYTLLFAKSIMQTL